MWIALGVMVYYAMEKRRRTPNGGFEKFWYTHHLFIPFFILWQLHGMFCMIRADRYVEPLRSSLVYLFCGIATDRHSALTTQSEFSGYALIFPFSIQILT